jgi:FkbM family methyltransferase
MLRGCATVYISEPELLGLAQIVHPGDVCLDIGAAYGMYTYPLAALVGPAGQVHSFEPLPNPYRILAAGRRASGTDHIHVYNAALGPVAGSHRMTLPYRFGLPIHTWAHLQIGLQRHWRKVSFSSSRTLTVQVRTVDEICARQGIAHVSFMKVDVEGFEAGVLTGAQRILKQCRPTLLLEIMDRHLDKYGMTSDDIVGFLRKQGYAMHAWATGRWVRVDRVTTGRRNYLFSVDKARLG